MPRNPRPPGAFGTGIIWGDSTLQEREEAQNQWDLLDAQEKSNELARENLKQQEEKARLERIRIQQQGDTALMNYISQINAQNKAEEIAKRQEYINICNNLKIDYKDMEMIEKALMAPSKADLSKRNNLENDIEKYKDTINKLENDIKNTNTFYEERQIQIAENEIDELNSKTYWWFQRTLKQERDTKIKQTQRHIEYYKKEIEKIEKEKAETLPFMQKAVGEYKQEMEKKQRSLEKLNDKIKNKSIQKIYDFLNFRANHYNADMEILFKKLNLYVGEIAQEDIIKNGTVNQYKTYIRDLILKEGV